MIKTGGKRGVRVALSLFAGSMLTACAGGATSRTDVSGPATAATATTTTAAAAAKHFDAYLRYHAPSDANMRSGGDESTGAPAAQHCSFLPEPAHR
jgi:hypothetical protein